MDVMFWLQALIVFGCVAIGGRFGGVGLGATGGLGVSLLVLGLGVKPGNPPVSVLLIITAVIACTSILQGAGGLDLLVHWAERLLRRWPKAITILGPMVCSFFVVLVGTAYVAFAMYPVVAEIATSAKVRPERPLAASVICAGIGVMASPMSAAMAAMVGIMAAYGIPFWQILAVTMPTYFLACLCASLSVCWRGCELENDPQFKQRIANGDFQWLNSTRSASNFEPAPHARRAVAIMVCGIAAAVLLGSVPGARPSWEVAGKMTPLPIPSLIQMVMLATASLIIFFCHVPPHKFASGSVFRSGLVGVVGVFGIAWLTGTFLDEYAVLLQQAFESIATRMPFLSRLFHLILIKYR